MTPAQRNKRPNILLVLSDQHRADVIGSAGNGLRCTNLWTESPICQPARASLLTGRYPLDHYAGVAIERTAPAASRIATKVPGHRGGL
jgi:arylsulfatase A-like enzyme